MKSNEKVALALGASPGHRVIRGQGLRGLRCGSIGAGFQGSGPHTPVWSGLHPIVPCPLAGKEDAHVCCSYTPAWFILPSKQTATGRHQGEAQGGSPAHLQGPWEDQAPLGGRAGLSITPPCTWLLLLAQHPCSRVRRWSPGANRKGTWLPGSLFFHRSDCIPPHAC